jgi:TPR repeat protein/S1-C subfamily serine protease
MAFRWLARVPVSFIAAGLILSIFLAVPSLDAEKKPKALTPAEIFKRAAPSVVAIDCRDGKNATISTASGFIISANGEIVTNFHVIKSCQNLLVRLTNGDVYDSTWVIAVDARRDLAIIQIKAASLPALPLAESNDLEVGQAVYCVGNARGLQNTLQQGLVSALREVNGSRLVQVSASINPGDSGGPILDDQGRVIAIASEFIRNAENLGFAIPIDYVKGYLDSKEETAFSVFAAETNPAPLGFEQFYKCPNTKALDDVRDLGDTVTPGACLSACKKQDAAAGCWWLDGSGGLPRDCRVCKTLAPVRMSYQNDWAIPIGTKSQSGVSDHFLPDANGKSSWIAPVYGQLLSFSFPRGLKPAYEKVNGPSYIQESVLEGETVDQWTQMITVTGAKGLASNPNLSPRKFAQNMADGYHSRCPNSFNSASVFDGKIGGYEGFAVVLSCGTSPLTVGKSESVLLNVIKGDSDYYTVQWAERAEASSTPIAIDTTRWLERFKRLEPIKLCQIVPGEAAPYPSCLESNTQPARTATTPPPVAIGRDAQPEHARTDRGSAGPGSSSDSGGKLAHAKELLSEKRFSEALAQFRESASEGNAEAQRYVGDAYMDGWGGVSQDNAQARLWYEKATAGGSAVAANYLGRFYSLGRGVEQDYARARELFEKAAAAGNGDAMDNLGSLYQNGKGVAQDYEQARHWYEKGASAGNAAAMSQLGYLYDHGLGVAQDYEQARQYYEKAAAAGYASAMNNLGSLYFFGHGVAQDYGQARQWFEKAAAAGNADAMFNLGFMYEHGQGVALDSIQARQWYVKAAAGGNASAKASLEGLPK